MNRPTLAVVCVLLAGSVFEGCYLFFIPMERSQPLSKATVTPLIGKTAGVDTNDDGWDDSEFEATICALAGDSLLLGIERDTRYVHFDSVREIVVKGAWWGRWAGGLIGAGVGGGIGALLGSRSRGQFPWSGDQTGWGAIGGGTLGLMLGGIAGDYFLTPDWSYRAPAKEPLAEPDSVEPPARPWEEQHALYVLGVDRFLEETDSFVVIPWQGGRVQLEKSAISIEKLEKGYRVTVPARLLPHGTNQTK